MNRLGRIAVMGRLAMLVCLVGAGPAGAGTTYLVSTNGGHAYPYDSWTNAATNIQAAIDVCSPDDTVLVSNGTYLIGQQILVSNRVTLTSLEGADQTVIQRTGSANFRVLYLTNTAAGAIVEGFTLKNGYVTSTAGGTGAGALVQAGTLRNCTVTNCTAASNGSYGGVHLSGGVVSNCTIVGNGAHVYGGGAGISGVATMIHCRVSANTCGVNASYGGGGLYMTANGLVEGCVVQGNRSGVGASGGGILMTVGTVRNCLVTGNTSGNAGGGISISGNGTIENCTIALNRSMNATAGTGLQMTSGTSINNIVYYNYPGSAFGRDAANCPNVLKSGGTYAYCDSAPLVAGEGNTDAEPLLVDRFGGDFRLLPGSPAIDAGSNRTFVATDIGGAARPVDGDGDGSARHDIGAYEMPVRNGGALRCGLTASTNESVDSLEVTFTAVPAGADTNVTWYGWDWTADGVVDSAGPGLGTVTWTYGPGLHSVALAISNAAFESASCTQTWAVRVAPSIVYAATNGGHVAPYTNWVGAATNIQAALDIVTAGSKVVLTNGTYGLGQQLELVKDIELLGAGTNATLLARVSAGNCRVLLMSASGGVVDGVAITNGQVSATDWGLGGGVRLHGGLIRNSLIVKNNAGNNGSGGGIYMTDGTLSNCVVRANYGWMGGNGVYMTGGTVRESLIVANGGGRNDMSGGGAYMTGGTLLNCVIRDNYAGVSSGRGGGVYQGGGTILNCTIAHNSAGGDGGGVTNAAGFITNSIIYFNDKLGVANNFWGNPTRAAYSCAPELTGGGGNVSSDPLFTDAVGRDYTLQLTSPCLDKGLDLAAAALDFAGASRPQDGDGDSTATTDMGAYEVPDAGAGPLQVGISGAPVEGLDLLEVVFTAQPAGADTNIVWYGWDFDGDGEANLAGPGLGTVTNPYGPGFHSVALTVTNGSGQRASATNANYVHVAPSSAFVWSGGTHTAPYTNWAGAATNLETALGLVLGGSQILVSNGTYGVTSPVVMDAAIAIRGAGRDQTIIAQTGLSGERRVIYMTSPSAVLEGVTVSNGYTTVFGGAGIAMSAGTVRNVTVVKNWASNNQHGGGLHMTGGLLEDSIIRGNTAHLNGGGIYVSGSALVRTCVIVGNTSGMNGGYHAGGVYQAGGTVRNCLIVGNVCGGGGAGGGARVDGGLLESCTVTGNRGGSDSGGVHVTSPGAVTNTIAYDNVLASGATNSAGGALTRFGFSCAPELAHDPSGTGNTTNAPGFRALGSAYGLSQTGGNFRLAPGAACENAGATFPWMSTATDLDGRLRVLGLRVDMGAYESYPSVGSVLILVN